VTTVRPNVAPTTAALLKLVSDLRRPESRPVASAALATAMGAEAMLVFVRDDEVDTLLPAPGFPQTLPDGKAWRAFLAECVREGHAVAPLSLQPGQEALCAQGYAWGNDAVFALLGRERSTADVSWFHALLPLLAGMFRGEQVAVQATVHARSASDAAARAATLAQMLDGARRRLEGALHTAREARVELEQANDRLQEQAIELEMANEQLREQAEATEAQAMELEIKAAQLSRANASLEEARRVAEEANQAKTEFLATMSHELRTPLNAVGGYAQLLQMELLGPVTLEQRQAFDRIDRAQRHLLGLINDILNLSRIEAGHVEYELVPVPLRELIGDIVSMIEPQLASKQLRYEIRDAESLPTALADREKLQQILLNLLSNAVKFTDPRGRIWIEAQESGESPRQVVIRVSDTGCGLPSDKLESIFEPFVQVRAELTRPHEGTGLGLAISRDLARGMGGDLGAESTLGVGSTFVLTLPGIS
jgi:signal transduction histidine kinase